MLLNVVIGFIIVATGSVALGWLITAIVDDGLQKRWEEKEVQRKIVEEKVHMRHLEVFGAKLRILDRMPMKTKDQKVLKVKTFMDLLTEFKELVKSLEEE